MKNALTFWSYDWLEEPVAWPQGLEHARVVRLSSGALAEESVFESGRRQPQSKTQAWKEIAANSFCLFCQTSAPLLAMFHVVAPRFSQTFPRLSKLSQAVPSRFKPFPRKKRLFIFVGGPWSYVFRDSTQINPPVQKTSQKQTKTNQKMNRTIELGSYFCTENGLLAPVNRVQNSYCQFRFSCYYLRPLSSSDGRGKRFIIASSRCGWLRQKARRRTIITSKSIPCSAGCCVRKSQAVLTKGKL